MKFNDMKVILAMAPTDADRLDALIEFGNGLEAIPSDLRDSAIEIVGCASRVAMAVRRDGDKLHFYGEADSMMVRGILAAVLAMVNEMNPDEIKKISIVDKIVELNLGLGAQRMNGLAFIAQYIKNQ